MAMNMRTFTQALAKTAAVIEKTVQTTVQEVTGPKPLQDYELLHQIGSAGPALAWKLYSAKARGGASLSQQYPVVCVWVLDKRSLSEARTRAGLSKAAEDAFFNVIRQDATRLVRMRHPGVVHVVQGLDENKNAMAMVTEPLFSSISNALGNVENISDIPKELKGIEMGLLEVKHGLLQLAETLDFLHQNARLVHRALSPESVLITATGAWKLGGFGFAISTDQASGGLTNEQAFHYAEFDTEDSMLPLQPSLNYTAPELVRSKASSGGCLSDIFSLGCLAYHLIARKPLLDCHNNVKMYMNSLNYLTSEAFSSIPSELVSDLQRMLSVNESSRPTATDFTGSPFFRNDTRLRALRFLDHMLERDNMQKSDFLKALSDMWKDFDSRVLRYKVLPPLCAELRNLVMQPMILPMVLTIAEAQERNDFELSTLPALLPVLSSASGDTLLLLVKHAELIIDKTSHVYLISHVLPMLVRAYDDNDPRLQEEVLKKSFSLAKHLDPQLVKQAIVPRVHSLALRTTVAAVRVNALICLGDLVQSLDKPAVLDVLQTIQRCTAVDRSPPTLMCTLRVSNSILKRYGTEFAAEHVLPLVTPLLTAQQLNVQQFAKFMHFIKDILRRLEEKRGVSITDSGVKEVGTSTAGGLPVGSSKMSDTVSASSAAKTSGASWDEDWNIPPPMRGASASVQPSTTSLPSSIKANEDNRMMDGISTKSNSFVTSSPPLTSNSSSQTISSSMGEFEWPPRAPSVSQQGFSSNGSNDHNSTADPFGDWNSQTRTGSVNGLSGVSNDSFAGLMMNKGGSTLSSSSLASDMNFQSFSGGTWGSNSQSLGDSSAISNLGSYGGNVGAQSSVGFFQQNQGVSGSGGEQKATDLGSIFSTSKSSHGALKLAPPPSNAVGRGRGRGRGGLGGQGQIPHRGSVGTSLSSGKPPSSEQPPLLDLL